MTNPWNSLWLGNIWDQLKIQVGLTGRNMMDFTFTILFEVDIEGNESVVVKIRRSTHLCSIEFFDSVSLSSFLNDLECSKWRTSSSLLQSTIGLTGYIWIFWWEASFISSETVLAKFKISAFGNRFWNRGFIGGMTLDWLTFKKEEKSSNRSSSPPR